MVKTRSSRPARTTSQYLREDVPDELHRDRAEPLLEGERGQVPPERARDAAQVDAAVLAEAAVLDGDEAVLDDRRHAVEVDDDAPLR